MVKAALAGAFLSLCSAVQRLAISDFTPSTNDVLGSDYAMSKCYDYKSDTRCIPWPQTPGISLQIDLGSQQTVRSFMMLQRYSVTEANTFDVYIGDTNHDSSTYMTDNKKCLTDVKQEGLANCSGTGRYLILKHSSVENDIKFSDIFVFDQSEVG